MFTPDGNDWRDRREERFGHKHSRSHQKSSALVRNFESQGIDIATAWAGLTKWLQGRRNYFVFNCRGSTTAHKGSSLTRFALCLAMYIPNREVARENLGTD